MMQTMGARQRGRIFSVGAVIRHHFAGRDLLECSVIRNVTPKASAMIWPRGPLRNVGR
jgi:hypothetical protein